MLLQPGTELPIGYARPNRAQLREFRNGLPRGPRPRCPLNPAVAAITAALRRYSHAPTLKTGLRARPQQRSENARGLAYSKTQAFLRRGVPAVAKRRGVRRPSGVIRTQRRTERVCRLDRSNVPKTPEGWRTPKRKRSPRRGVPAVAKHRGVRRPSGVIGTHRRFGPGHPYLWSQRRLHAPDDVSASSSPRLRWRRNAIRPWDRKGWRVETPHASSRKRVLPSGAMPA